MRWKLIALIGAIVLCTAAVTTVVHEVLMDEAPLGGNAEQLTLDSRILNEKREYAVILPESYAAESARHYPVLYVLDGQAQAGHTASAAALMARIGVMPELIVVGVSSMDGERRNRDYTPPDMRLDTDSPGGPNGSGERFLAFLRDELIPAVQTNYRTRQPRMLAGWSRGGLFVAYSMLAAPTLFDARFAHSPALWREDDLIVTQLERRLASNDAPAGFLFLSLGDQENDKMKASFTHATAVLQAGGSPEFAWRSVMTRDGVHDNNARLATPLGFCAYFATPMEPGAPTCPSGRP